MAVGHPMHHHHQRRLHLPRHRVAVPPAGQVVQVSVTETAEEDGAAL